MFSIRSIATKSKPVGRRLGCVSVHSNPSFSALPNRILQLRSASKTTPPPAAVVHYKRCLSSTVPRSARYLRFSPDPDRPFDVSRWDIGTKVVAGLVVLGGVYYVVHLERVPETGRLRFMDISAKYEAQLAEASRKELLQTFQDHMLPPNHPITIHISQIVAKILESSNLGTVKSDYLSSGHAAGADDDDDGWSWKSDEASVPGSGTREWTVMVVNDPNVVNAMASFGNVVVFTGILPVCKDQHGLASVLGHEIGHVVARHSSERYSNLKVLIGIALLFEALGLEFGLARLLTTYLMELPHSRTQELEADEIGMRLIAKACFDPTAVPAFMKRLGEAVEGGRGKYDFLHTHPSSRRRVERLNELLPDAYAMQAASPGCGGVQDQLRAFGEAVGQTDGAVVPLL